MRTDKSRAGSRLTYANVVSTLALVIAVGGSGAVVASVAVPKNSVGSPQIKNGQVKTPDLGKKSVTGPKIRNNAVKGNHVKDGSLGAADLSPGSIGLTRGYVWNGTSSGPLGAPQTINHVWAYNSSGGAITVTRTGVGAYSVAFEGLTLERGNVQVSGYGSDNVDCKVANWGGNAAYVRCFNPAGALANGTFTLAYID